MKNKLNKITLTAIAASFAFSTAFAANLPKNCMEEIIDLSKKRGFNMQKFMKELPPEVVKIKAQAKAPVQFIFGPGSDDKVTDIGLTVGCLKAFPESTSQIQSLLKDVSLKIGTDLAANKLEIPKITASTFNSTNSAAVPIKVPAVQQNVIVNMAVIETKVDAEPAVAKEFKPSELSYITKEIHRQAINNLPKTKFTIIAEQSQAQGDMISLGKKIGADFITQGTVSKFRKNYILTVEIYDAKNGKLVLSSDPVESEKAEVLLSGFREIAPDFFKRLEGELSGFRKTAPAPSKQAPNNSNTVCKTETDKAKSIYDECVKMGKASNGYTKCAEDYKEQKGKAEQVCKAASITSQPASFNIFGPAANSVNQAPVSQSPVPVTKDYADAYKTIKMPNGKVWMAENVNYKTGKNACYQNNASICQKCGLLYDWETAKTVCPVGWHLPSDAEWTALENAIGGSSTAGEVLKSKSGWNGNGNGTDKYGFSAFACGYGYSGGESFGSYGLGAYFWSATENDSRLCSLTVQI
jgi:uncharacterized protein (TIGR02145 family)